MSKLHESPRLIPFAHSIIHNRNRTYNPQLGRFMQADPNASALALLEAASYNGRGVGALAIAFDLSTRHGDGANLYEYLGSNPWNRSDPMGLSWDPFDMVDEYLAESAGEKAAFLSRLGQGGTAVAIVAAHIASYLPFPAMSVAGELALVVLGEQSGETAAIAVGVGLIPGGKLMGKLGKLMSGITGAAWDAAKTYAASRIGRFMWNTSAAGLISRAWKAVKRKRAAPDGSCPIRCFVAGTLVWTSMGMVPIESVQVGDCVLSWNEATGDIQSGLVTATVSVPGAPLLNVTLIHESGRVETIRTTDDHPFYVVTPGAMPGWVEACNLRATDLLATIGGASVVESIQFTSSRETVYNFSVAGTSNYYIGHDGVLVHNCKGAVAAWKHLIGHQDKSVLPRRIQEFGASSAKDLLNKIQNIIDAPHTRWSNSNMDMAYVQGDKIVIVRSNGVDATAFQATRDPGQYLRDDKFSKLE